MLHRDDLGLNKFPNEMVSYIYELSFALLNMIFRIIYSTHLAQYKSITP